MDIIDLAHDIAECLSPHVEQRHLEQVNSLLRTLLALLTTNKIKALFILLKLYLKHKSRL